jgi:uncharacterized protein (TIGR03435 family)
MVNARSHLELKRLLGVTAALAIAIAFALATTGCASKAGTHRPEANGGHPWFKTASIKLDDAPAEEIRASGNEFVAIEPAIDMIMFAYGQQRPLKPAQVLGGPGWTKTEAFNIDAQLPKSLSEQLKPPFRGVGPPVVYLGDAGQTDAMKHIFRSLLINRFKLQVKHETKVLPVYELVLATNGPKIAEDKTAGGSCRIGDLGPGKGRWLDVTSCDFATVVGLLSTEPELRSQVLVDKTGLHGSYSFKVRWTPKMPPGMRMPARVAQSNRNVAPPEPSGPSLLVALQEQLGLKVQSTTAPMDTVAIEHIENPVKN